MGRSYQPEVRRWIRKEKGRKVEQWCGNKGEHCIFKKLTFLFFGVGEAVVLSKGRSLLSKEHLAMSGEIWGCHNRGVMQLVGGGQQRCSTSNDAQDTIENDPTQNIDTAKGEQPWSGV